MDLRFLDFLISSVIPNLKKTENCLKRIVRTFGNFLKIIEIIKMWVLEIQIT